MPPLFVGNELVTDFLEKSNLFTFLIDNAPQSSTTPLFLQIHPSKLNMALHIEFSTRHIKFIKALDPNKAHGHGEMSVCLIELCTSSILEPLLILLKTVWKMNVFSRRRQI